MINYKFTNGKFYSGSHISIDNMRELSGLDLLEINEILYDILNDTKEKISKIQEICGGHNVRLTKFSNAYCMLNQHNSNKYSLQYFTPKGIIVVDTNLVVKAYQISSTKIDAKIDADIEEYNSTSKTEDIDNSRYIAKILGDRKITLNLN